MSRLAAERDALKQHIQFMYFVIFVLLCGCGALWYGWYKAPNLLRVSIPPDLRHGAIVRPGEYAAANVEIFASSIFREINRWEEDGNEDYGLKIFANQSYLTPRYRAWLIEDMNQKKDSGELDGRQRWVLELDSTAYDSENVESLDDGSWVVHLRLRLVEEVGGLKAKDVKIHYPLRIVKMNISPQKNFWGLAIDGYPIGSQESLIEESKDASS